MAGKDFRGSHLTRGNELYAKGDFEGAISEYTESIRLEKERDVAAYNKYFGE